ncbi:hypothetical protein CUMW_055580 [Citrus unshiu]|nr:hypothetical protein CUMW_055580 [Citrus unshiu]
MVQVTWILGGWTFRILVAWEVMMVWVALKTVMMKKCQSRNKKFARQEILIKKRKVRTRVMLALLKGKQKLLKAHNIVVVPNAKFARAIVSGWDKSFQLL